jgi:predicted amidohydrolase YtcJ
MAVLTIVLLAGLIVGASPAPEVDTIFFGGDIVTMDYARPIVEALAVGDGRIVALGGEAEMRSLADGRTERIDLQGHTLLPGLIEPHCHPIATAILGRVLDVSGFTHDSRAAVMASLAEAVEGSDTGEWLIAFGWDPVLIEDLENPTLAELDALAPDVPLFILTQMMHHGFINSAGYRAAGITVDTPDPPGGGAFLRDAAGELNGVVYEVSALQHVMQATPPPPPGAAQLLLNLQFAEYAKAGFTAIGILGPVDGAGYPLDFLFDLGASPEAVVRSFVYATPKQLDRSGWPAGHGRERFRLSGVKLYMDGSPYTGGAAFAEPYLNTPLTRRIGLDPDHRGTVNYSSRDLAAVIGRFHERGHQVAVHVQGEVAVDATLRAFAQVLEESPREDHRHRLEHNALITDEQLAKARDLGLTPSFFIDHIHFYGKGLHDIVGPRRAARFMPIGSALRAGHVPTIHTDNPATPIDPFRAIRTAVTRQMLGGGVLGADQRISVWDALEAVTINAAWQMFEEEERGSLEVGKAADFVLLSDNPLAVDAEDLDQIEVLGTWIDGERVDTSPYTWLNLKLAARVVWEMLMAKVASWVGGLKNE